MFFFHSGLFGIGINRQTILHWIRFIWTITHAILYLYRRNYNFSFEITTIAYDFSLSLFTLTLLILMMKRKFIKDFYLTMQQLTPEQRRILFVMDKILCTIAIMITVKDQLLQLFYFRHCCIFDYISGLVKDECFWNNMICFQTNYIMNWIFCTSSLYFMSYLILHFNTVQILKSIEQLIISGGEDHDKVFLLTMRREEVHSMFENTFSPVLFTNLLCNSMQITRILYDSLRLKGFKRRILYISDSLDIVSLMLINFSTILAISLLQEHIQKRVGKIIQILRYQGIKKEYSHKYMITSQTIESSFFKSPSVWGFVQVKRRLLVSLVSSYIIFPVLLVQINNGALEKPWLVNHHQIHHMDEHGWG